MFDKAGQCKQRIVLLPNQQVTDVIKRAKSILQQKTGKAVSDAWIQRPDGNYNVPSIKV